MSEELTWFLSIEEQPNASNKIPNQSLRISQVASGSPAQKLNLAEGDWFVSINDISAVVADVPEMLVSNKVVDYVFIRKSDTMKVTASTPALPVGIRTEFISEDIVLSYKSKSLHDFEGIRTLWERREYKHIRQICTSAKSSGSLGKVGLSNTNKSALLDVIIAICDIEEEIANTTKAYDLIRAFDKQYGDQLTTDITGLLDYYIAQDCRTQGNSNGYQNAMYRAMECPFNQESPRLKQEADNNSISYRDKSPHIGSKFGPFGGMELIVGDENQEWNDSRITPYCLMLTYRGNAPYENGLKVYRSIYPFLKDKMRPMIVMTSEREKSKDHPEHFISEDAMISENLPIYVLYGYKTFWADLVMASAPEFLVVSHEGAKILWHADLNDDFAYWQMLSVTEEESS